MAPNADSCSMLSPTLLYDPTSVPFVYFREEVWRNLVPHASD
jgi:hypothetical protein